MILCGLAFKCWVGFDLVVTDCLVCLDLVALDYGLEFVVWFVLLVTFGFECLLVFVFKFVFDF